MSAMKQAILAFASRFASVEVLQLARWELKLRARSLVAAVEPRQRAILAGIRREKRSDLKVNLGCGPLPIPGWLNVDGVASEADLIQVLGRPLDLPDGCAALVFSEHALEHIDYPTAARTFMREAHRILRPGGRFRVVVPDAERAIRAYAAADADLLRRLAPTEASPIQAVNRIFRENGFHRFAWDYPLLEAELQLAGFGSVRSAKFRDSPVPELNVDYDQSERIIQSLYVEAVK
jgi:predicted SAM-dependent methyltransferase